VHFPSPLSDQTEDEHPPHAPESAAMALNSDVLQLIFMHFEKVINKVLIKVRISSGNVLAPQRVTRSARCAQVKDIGSVAKVCTTWRRVVVESPELYDKPLRLKFRASVIDDANGMLARRGCTAPADARMLYIICCEERLTQQIERYAALLLWQLLLSTQVTSAVSVPGRLNIVFLAGRSASYPGAREHEHEQSTIWKFCTALATSSRKRQRPYTADRWISHACKWKCMCMACVDLTGE
jgi:hypothetical protein